ncbi:hypothetical protein KTT66_12640 [Lacticaseibacillus casei]|jgi:hypothetical protein|uniref:Uncharacterized protein n=1 Tax=Lacticaseibacillus huelsenbergensis TaxID=3035291 RepID=A0ABY8DRF0_9LACO|nr:MULTISPECIES: hypothetical protein [Lacticaseibacillus]MDG3061030.1 hypothetical protein [Lacticaseibacillus sp. BCRC 81376]QVI37199.1 hypothetical protein KGS74_13460 [Lacticaseibacillus casei]QXG58991.1 hypothetical protein KTT66_12640 [Lacticaseibacillus casei]WFB39564.1 hypothetical protein LHUE1_000291 [Lacticaseibacillus huelsenbergensis]WFB41264.1 hypothetical protein LHUE2_002072 [Lacticaseibacillus huelsenbergensis]
MNHLIGMLEGANKKTASGKQIGRINGGYSTEKPRMMIAERTNLTQGDGTANQRSKMRRQYNGI